MGVDQYSESACLLLAHTLFAAELKHAAAKGVLSDKALDAQRSAAKKLLAEDPARTSVLKHLVSVCGKSREDLEAMVVKSKARCPDEYYLLQPWIGDFVLAQIASVANSVLRRFGVPCISEWGVVSHFADPMQGYDDFPNEPLQLYLSFAPADLWSKDARPKESTQRLCRFVGIKTDSLRERSWVRISF